MSFNKTEMYTKSINKNTNVMHNMTRIALIDCLNHISKSFDLFLNHINTNNKYQKNQNKNKNENSVDQNCENNPYTDLNSQTKNSKNSIFSFSTVFSTSSLPISDLTNSYSKAENQIAKIMKSRNKCKVIIFFLLLIALFIFDSL